MNMKRIYIIASLLPLICSETVQTSQTSPHALHPYLRRKLDSIIKSISEENAYNGLEASRSDALSVRVVTLDIQPLPGEACSAVLRAWGGMRVILQDSAFSVHAHDNGHMYAEFEKIVPGIDGFQDVKSTIIGDHTMILFTYPDGHSSLHLSYGTTWDSLRLMQTIGTEDVKVVSSAFFHHQAKLYLAIAYARGHTILYEWTGSYMDEVVSLPADSAIDLAIINKLDCVYIAVAEQFGDGGGVTIFKFTPSDGLYKLHRIPFKYPKKLLAYEDLTQGEDDFLFILNKEGKVTILKLFDDEFLLFANANSKKIPEIAEVGYIEGLPVIYMAHKNVVTINTVSSEGLKEVSSIVLDGDQVTRLMAFEEDSGFYRVVIISTTKNGNVITMITLAAKRSIIITPPPIDSLRECLMYLKNQLANRQIMVDEILNKANNINEINDIRFNGLLESSSEITLSASKVQNLKVASGKKLNTDFVQLENIFLETEKSLRQLEEAAEQVIFQDKPIQIENFVEIQGDLKVGHLEASAASANVVNGQKFAADVFVTEPPEEIKILDSDFVRELQVINLMAPNMFVEVLRKASTFQSLAANNIYIPESKSINDVPIADIVLQGYDGELQGHKIFHTINAINVETEKIGNINIQEALEAASAGTAKVYHLRAQQVNVRDLRIVRAQGLDMESLMNDTYQRNAHKPIIGDLIFKSGVEVEKLTSVIFQDIPVSKMLTKTTRQTINGQFFAAELQISNPKVQSLNGLNVNKDIALKDRHNVVRTPTSIRKLQIKKNLFLNCGTVKESFCNVTDVRPEDLLQIYSAPVTIQGNVRVHQIKFDREADVVISGEPFVGDWENTYWMKSKEQVLPLDVTFERGLTVEHLEVENVNGVNLESHLRFQSDWRNLDVSFHELEVDHDVEVPINSQCGELSFLSRNAVKKSGCFQITGKKVFRSTVRANNLFAETVNDVEMDDLVLKNDRRNKKFTDPILLEKLHIRGNLHAECDIEAKRVGGIDLTKMVKHAVKVNQPARLESLVFENEVEASEINVETGLLADLSRHSKIVFDGINVTVEGDVSLMAGVNGVRNLNDVDFDSYVGQVVNRNVGGEIGGMKRFNKGLVVTTYFDCETINDVDVGNIVKKALLKAGDQVITGKFKVDKVYAAKLSAEVVNEIRTADIVDRTSQPVVVNSDLTFDQIDVEGHLKSGAVNFDVEGLTRALGSAGAIGARCWAELRVAGDARWYGDRGDVTRILEEAVHAGHKNVILANVVFNTSLEVEDMNTVEDTIDGVNIVSIAEDAVRKSTPFQVITGKKTFESLLSANHVEVDELRTKHIINHDLDRIDRTMATRDGNRVIGGHKTFKSDVIIDEILTHNPIRGIPPLDNIVTTSSVQKLQKVISSNDISADNLFIGAVNGVNFTEFLDSIIYLNGNPIHLDENVTFESVVIDKLSNVQTINGVNVKDIIVDSPEGSPILVKGEKYFKHLVVEGDAEVEYLNDKNVLQTFNGTVWADMDTVFEGNINLSGQSIFAKELKGNIQERNMKKDLDTIIDEGHKYVDQSGELLRSMVENLEEIKETLRESSPYFIYAEVVKRTPIKSQNVRRIHALCNEDKHECRLEIMESTEDGTLCGLPKACFCPQQTYLKLSQKATGNIDMQHIATNKGRIFTVEGASGVPIAQIVTKSVSSDAFCQTNGPIDPSNEDVILQWLYEDGDTVSESVDISRLVFGYISDVTTFTMNGATIVVIAKSYDVSRRNSNGNSVVIELDYSKRLFSLLQRLPTNGEIVLTSHESAAGILLLVGQKYNSRLRLDNVTSHVYKYDDVTEQFILATKVKTTGCHQVCAALAGDHKSYLMFAQSRNEPVIVVRFNPRTQEYVQQQSLLHEGQVTGMIVVNAQKGGSNGGKLLCVSTTNEPTSIFIYTMSTNGWKLHSSGSFKGANSLVPLNIAGQSYVYVPSANSSAILSLKFQGLGTF